MTDIRVREIAGSEEGFDGWDSGAESRVYRAWDADSDTPDIDALKTAVLTEAPSSIGSKSLDKLTREYDEDGRSWIFTADYNYKIPESTLSWGFDTQGGSIRVTHSLQTTKYVASGTAPEFNGGIGYSNGEIQGVDKVIPALKLYARYRWPADTLTTSAVNAMAAMTGTVNSALWQTYAAGELLFLGASGEIVPGKPTEVTYQFAASANATGLTIGSISSIAKAGHRYLWVLWEDDEDATAKRLTKNPLAVYVEKIYTETAFTALGIG